jgi:hypothetical protein
LISSPKLVNIHPLHNTDQNILVLGLLGLAGN